MNKKKNNKGFSLIELIIAIAILIILTGLLAPKRRTCRLWIQCIHLYRRHWQMRQRMMQWLN